MRSRNFGIAEYIIKTLIPNKKLTNPDTLTLRFRLDPIINRPEILLLEQSLPLDRIAIKFDTLHIGVLAAGSVLLPEDVLDVLLGVRAWF